MSTTFISISIYTTLLIAHILAVQALVYRVVFVDWFLRRCDANTFRNLLSKVKTQQWTGIDLSSDAFESTWLECDDRFESAEDLAAHADDVRVDMDCHLGLLHLVSGNATLIGLFGTIAGFMVAPDINDVGLDLAFRTTALGIVVSLPATCYLTLSEPIRILVHQQLDDLQHAITTSVAPKASSSRSKASSGVERPRGTERKPLATPPASTPKSKAAQRAFSECVASWLTGGPQQ